MPAKLIRTHLPTKCLLCNHCKDAAEAVAVFYFSHGCACRQETVQPLCAQHAFKATPIVDMELIKDLTVDGRFTKIWNERAGK